jgi:hypothetical protein
MAGGGLKAEMLRLVVLESIYSLNSMISGTGKVHHGYSRWAIGGASVKIWSLFGPRRKFIWTFTLVLLLIFAISGCAATQKARMYSGEAVDANKQSVIRADRRAPNTRFHIISVDGERTLTDFYYFLTQGRVEEVHVLPGKHRLITRIDNLRSNMHAMGDLWLIAEPGESYILKARSQGYRVYMWLENERTGQRVGGVTGSDDEPK